MAWLAETGAEDCPMEFVCPISMQLMRRPCATSDGMIYEWMKIEEWLCGHDTSPLTNEPISKELTDDRVMSGRIEQWLLKLRDNIMEDRAPQPLSLRCLNNDWSAGPGVEEDDDEDLRV